MTEQDEGAVASGPSEGRSPEERIDAYIGAVRWVEAKTWQRTFPHEYTIREWAPEREEDFIFFVKYIRENGRVEPFFSKRYTYLRWHDGYKYWTLGNPIESTNVINRAMPGRDRGA
jgi:hypothetical protein